MEKMSPDVLRGNPCPVYCPVCQANRKLTANGFYSALERELLQLLYQEYAVNDSLTILDVGTGEGALFSNILLCMRWDQYRHHGIGIDHCRHAVKTAAQHDQQALWLVAEPDEIPVKAQAVDVILNTLAPANYEEFDRILQPGGLLIKTIPGPGHLQELRNLLQEEANGDDQPVEKFPQYLAQEQEKKVRFQKELQEEEKEWLLDLSPIKRGVLYDKVVIQQLSTITIDLIIVCGRKSY